MLLVAISVVQAAAALGVIAGVRAHAPPVDASIPPSAEWATHWFDGQPDEVPSPGQRRAVTNGTVPSWVAGTLTRAGLGQWVMKNRRALHMFDGLAKVSQWTFVSGGGDAQPLFKNVFLKGKLWQAAQAEGGYPHAGRFGPFQPPVDMLAPKVSDDNNNVNVWAPGDGTILALTDGPLAVALDAATLDTLGAANYSDDVGSASSSCAHGLPDVSPQGVRGTGSASGTPPLLNFVSIVDSTVGKLNITVYRVDTTSSSSSTGDSGGNGGGSANGAGTYRRAAFGTAQVPLGEWSYMHSFARTETRMIITKYPALFDFVTYLLGMPLTDCISWKPDAVSELTGASGTPLIVFDIPQPGKEVKETPPVAVASGVPAFYAWHSVNAYDTSTADSGDAVAIDVLGYDDFSKMTDPSYSFAFLNNSHDTALYNGTFRGNGYLRRMTIDMGSGAGGANGSAASVDLPMIDAHGNVYTAELPRMNPHYEGRKYCFFWAMVNNVLNSTWWQDMGVIKVDVCKAAAVAARQGPQWAATAPGRRPRLAHPDNDATVTGVWHRSGHMVGEPVFVPRPGGTAEDDGVVMAHVLDGSAQTSYLVIINATTMEQLARVDAPYRIPFELHAEWVPAAVASGVTGGVPANDSPVAAASVSDAATDSPPTIELHEGANQVFNVAVSRGNTTTTNYLGTFDSTMQCQDACIAFTHGGDRCESFTHHATSFGGAFAGQCFAITVPRWTPTAQKAVTSGRVLWPCRTNMDCSLNGQCDATSGSCSCEPQWAGHRCDALQLRPAKPDNGYQGVDDGANTSSWGGAVLRGDDDGLWHMFAAEMTNHCGIDTWFQNSRIIHATSSQPDGPFQRVGQVWPAFAHEPEVVRAPTGEWVMFFSAVFNSGAPPCVCSNGTTGAGDCPSEAVLTPHAARHARDPESPGGLRGAAPTFMSYAPSPDGPWSSPVNIFPDHHGADTNFAPVIMEDGSLVGLWRNWLSEGSRVYLATATDWRNASTYVQESVELWPDLGPMGTEDPFLYLDEDGTGVHAIFHLMYGLPAPLDTTQWWLEAAGAHAYSPDGVRDWTFGGLAYGQLSVPGNTVPLTDGTNRTFSRRERPHFVIDPATKRPSHITNAVDTGDGLCASPSCAHGGDGCQTLVQPLAS